MVGYDLDGVICQKPEIDKKYRFCNGFERKVYREIRRKHILETKLVRKPKEKKYVIITGRKVKDKENTLIWLKKNGLNPKEVYCMDKQKTRNNMIEHKSSIINSLKLKKYYEDDKKIANKLVKLCPKTVIFFIEPTVISYSISGSYNKLFK